MKPLKSYAAGAIAIGITFAIALAAALPAAPAQAQESNGTAKVKVRVGYFSQLHDAAVLDLQEQLGNKYAFEYVKFQRYADAAIALSRGDIDVSSLGYANLITEAAKNTEPKFRFIVGLARGAINLVCRNDVPIKSWPDLKSKTVGIVAGFPEIFLDDALRTHGGSPDDVKKVNFAVAGPPVLQALKDKTTDCSAVFEPFGATAVSGGYAYYPPTDIGDNSFKGLNNALAVNTEFQASHGAILKDIAAATATSTRKFREHPQQWIDFMTKSQGFASNIVEIGVKHVVLDSALYPQEAFVLSGDMKALGLIREQPTAAQLKKFFAN